eukprot:6573366-Ditylum_brightwellii.AAC.1
MTVRGHSVCLWRDEEGLRASIVLAVAVFVLRYKNGKKNHYVTLECAEASMAAAYIGQILCCPVFLSSRNATPCHE